jgi:hypothetical protein
MAEYCKQWNYQENQLFNLVFGRNYLSKIKPDRLLPRQPGYLPETRGFPPPPFDGFGSRTRIQDFLHNFHIIQIKAIGKNAYFSQFSMVTFA